MNPARSEPGPASPPQAARDARWIARAIELARQSATSGGGPFGAVIARGDELLAEGVNRVTLDLDPTAHAEVNAIRAACAKAREFKLEGATLYSSCEPCPMCLGAIHWARLERLVFACSRSDAAAAGFDDEWIYRELALPLERRSVPTLQLARELGVGAFDAWRAFEGRTDY
jgi:guanine deaminase